jgi:hypothetical protein
MLEKIAPLQNQCLSLLERCDNRLRVPGGYLCSLRKEIILNDTHQDCVVPLPIAKRRSPFDALLDEPAGISLIKLAV